MKILVTGGSGFVGQHLIRELLNQHYDVYSTFLEPPVPENLLPANHWFHLDNLNEDNWRSILKNLQPDGILHLAGLANVANSWEQPRTFLRINCEGTLLLLETVRQLRLKPRIIVVGSAEVYGLVRPEDNPVSENHPVHPRSPYGTSKACQEIVAQQYAQAFAIDVILTRPFNHIGPGQRLGYVAADFAAQIAAIEAHLQEPVIRVGNLSAVRDFTDVRDIARAYRLLLESGQTHTIYNICSGRGVSIQELLETMLTLTSADVRVEVVPEKYRPVDLPVLVGDPTRIRKTTGWQPTITLEDTLRDILIYWREHGLNTRFHPG